MKSLLRLLLAVGLVLPALSFAQTTSEEEEAGDVSEVDKDRLGPLRERVRPVSGHLFLKKGRFEVSPSASVSLRDALLRERRAAGRLDEPARPECVRGQRHGMRQSIADQRQRSVASWTLRAAAARRRFSVPISSCGRRAYQHMSQTWSP